MHVVKAGTALVPAIIGAVGAVAAAFLSLIAALRAQSRRQMLDAIDELLRKYADEELDDFKDELRQILDARTRGLYMAEIFKRAIRDVNREERGRRWWHRG